ncbi:MAG: hypothetical protein KF797_12825, partial [Flavobacteriales bacterium]|nr:hypothetical protein [Flavobacteriales bacterium]
MDAGTYPASGGKPVALVLGGAIAHVGLVIELKKRGYFTIIVDYYADPPAKRYADEHVRESTLDQ